MAIVLVAAGGALHAWLSPSVEVVSEAAPTPTPAPVLTEHQVLRIVVNHLIQGSGYCSSFDESGRNTTYEAGVWTLATTNYLADDCPILELYSVIDRTGEVKRIFPTTEAAPR